MGQLSAPFGESPNCLSEQLPLLDAATTAGVVGAQRAPRAARKSPPSFSGLKPLDDTPTRREWRGVCRFPRSRPPRARRRLLPSAGVSGPLTSTNSAGRSKAWPTGKTFRGRRETGCCSSRPRQKRSRNRPSLPEAANQPALASLPGEESSAPLVSGMLQPRELLPVRPPTRLAPAPRRGSQQRSLRRA